MALLLVHGSSVAEVPTGAELRASRSSSRALGDGAAARPGRARSVVAHDQANAQLVGGALGLTRDRVVVVADEDDDDVNGEPDGTQARVVGPAGSDVVPLAARYVGARLVPIGEGVGRARVVAEGRVVPWGEKLPAGAGLQGVRPGQLQLSVKQGERQSALVVDVYGFSLRDGRGGVVDMTRAHASLERTVPERAGDAAPDAPFEDPDALRLMVTSPEGASLPRVSVRSVSASGAWLDRKDDVALAPVPCGAGLACAATAPLRFVVDDVDRNHPLVRARSLRAEVGGAVAFSFEGGRKLQAIRVGGPRMSPVGPIGRHRLTVRPVVMRVASGSGPAIGGTLHGAVAALREELAVAAATWGQCGVSFAPLSVSDVRVMDPPPPYLVAFGDDAGLSASGGEIHLRVGPSTVALTTKRGWSTRQAALELVRVAKKAGLSATVSENARISAGAAPSVDVILKTSAGALADVEVLSSTDRTLAVAVGGVDLEDGLQHFRDTDAASGTLEERALIKAVEDGDPSTVEVVVVPYFAGGGRIGESFIGSDGSSLRNVVILDRAGIRARHTSFTLAHELGHVILDEPGHPDDYGVDTPSLLMDSDASDASPFGPRRLTTDECARAMRQSGPSARVPLLTPWKLEPIVYRAP